ncbi:hypothetical protein [Campylobacter helveticus]|uniref:hypothetical protein n=1 Tax=Campylobacter helveticus TaxID=28898 RepID=UPI00294383FC|nr:hypothetical protein [Campylobacter helveticus]
MTHIKNFKQALIKGEVVFILTKVSKGGMQRSFKVLYYHKKQFNPIPLDIAKSVGDGLDKNGDIKIRGVGMDMSFALWLKIVRYFKLNYQELGQNFKAYISFEEFMQCNSHMQEVVNLNNEVAL